MGERLRRGPVRSGGPRLVLAAAVRVLTASRVESMMDLSSWIWRRGPVASSRVG
mgnify:CR=1 FL=1